MIENEKLTMELTGGMKAPQNRIQGNLRGSLREEGTQCWDSCQFLIRAEELKEG